MDGLTQLWLQDNWVQHTIQHMVLLAGWMSYFSIRLLLSLFSNIVHWMIVDCRGICLLKYSCLLQRFALYTTSQSSRRISLLTSCVHCQHHRRSNWLSPAFTPLLKIGTRLFKLLIPTDCGNIGTLSQKIFFANVLIFLSLLNIQGVGISQNSSNSLLPGLPALLSMVVPKPLFGSACYENWHDKLTFSLANVQPL